MTAWKNEQVSREETDKIIEIARECLKLPGDFVEMGCYKGDTSLLLAEVLRMKQGSTCGKPVENFDDKPVENLRKSGGKEDLHGEIKNLWIYDSFEGLPEKSAVDNSVMGVDFKGGELLVTKREVKERFLRAGLRLPIIKKAWFKDLTEADLPEKIALAFLDGDFYESIKDSLKLVENKMVRCGVIIVHDYSNPALPGVARAVNEWRAKKDLEVEEFCSMIIVRETETT